MDIEKLNNKKIDIFGTKYTIRIVDKLEDNVNEETHYYEGVTRHNLNLIEIARFVKEAKKSTNDMIITLLHEINHAIFGSGQYHSCNNDEPLVEWVAKCYYSLLFKQKLFS